MLDTAVEYTRRGWSVVPVPHRGKNPGFTGWQLLRLKEEELSQRFNGKPQNIGVLTGEPSGWLIDVDLDHPRAVELAPNYLPATPAIFGRAGNQRSHWLYRVTAPMATKKFKSKSANMILEVRSTGCQTVVPPSTHKTGEAIEWEEPGAEPAEVEPEALLEAAKQLADAVLIELGEKTSKPPKKPKPERKHAKKEEPEPTDRAAACLAAMLRIQNKDQRDGSFRLFICACRTVEYDLDDETALRVIAQYAKQKPFARDWTDAEICQRIQDAEKICRRGSALEADEEGIIALGARDPQSGRLVLSPKRTLPTALAFERDFYPHPDGRMLQCYAGMLLEWRDNRYVELEDNAVRQRLQEWLHDAKRYMYNRSTGQLDLVDFESNPGSVKSALDSIKASTHLPASTPAPSWLDSKPSGLPPNEILPCRSTLLHLPTMTHHPATPGFFTFNALEYDPDPTAPNPVVWLQFLYDLFGDDEESYLLLQEWFGYCLVGDTSQQKMMLMVGPKRSGKG
ncbi:MAG: bifunctional DNA primase/polymerase, partial [Aureliella sp.]